MLNFNIEDYELVDVLTGEDEGLKIAKEDYTSFEQLLEHIRRLPDKAVKVSTRSLSVNGKVTKDKMETYLAATGESSSLLKTALNTPRHYYIERHRLIKPKSGRHFDFGTFCHSAVLEPEKFAKVRILPEANRSTIEGCKILLKYYWDLLGVNGPVNIDECKIGTMRDMIEDLNEEAINQGYSFVSHEDEMAINVIRVGFNTYGGGFLPKLMKYVQTETSMYGNDPSTGLKVKIRPDGMLLEENFGINAILSVKTTSATSVNAFLADCAKFKYELSEGMYLQVASHITGRPFTATLMLMIQSVAPFQIALLFWDAEDLEIGKYKYQMAIDTVAKCRESGEWPAFDAMAEEGAFGIIKAKLPKYIKNELPPQYLGENEC